MPVLLQAVKTTQPQVRIFDDLVLDVVAQEFTMGSYFKLAIDNENDPCKYGGRATEELRKIVGDTGLSNREFDFAFTRPYNILTAAFDLGRFIDTSCSNINLDNLQKKSGCP